MRPLISCPENVTDFWRQGLIATIALTGVIVSTPTIVQAQASETEMKSFPMPPPSGYATTKTFSYVGDYGYFLKPSTATYGMTANAQDYRYVRYKGVKGKNLWVYGAWGTTSIGNVAPNGGDNCGHAHVSYGVWVKFRYKAPLPESTYWAFVGGGGMSGMRNNSGQCVHKVDNPLKNVSSSFGWGKEAINLNLKNLPAYIEPEEVVVGALANTHGWGSCPVSGGAFPACHEPAWIIGYTLP